jgi:dienelactone hydrolase
VARAAAGRGSRGALAIALLSLPATLGGCAPHAAVPRPVLPADAAGVIAFESAGTLVPGTDGRSLVAGEPLTLSGELRFPEGMGPFPAVVLAHGCNGNRRIERAWGGTLRAWGYATFVIDSFSARGLREVCTRGRALTPTQRIPDAYGALRLLARHPRIDAKRVALMGFSHGGSLTLRAATVWARQTYAPPGTPSFRAFLPFYPNCNAEYPERARVSAPVRIHTDELDDWTPAAPCVRLAQALKAGGEDTAIAVYPGAHHAFDMAGKETYRPEVGNGSNCFPRYASLLGPILESTPGCARRGATVAGNREAAALARANVRAQLIELLNR